MNADLVVVGSGLAGLTAARRGQELGARVVLLERTPEPPGWNNSRIASGALHASYRNMREDPEVIYAKVMRDTDGQARPELVRAWAQNCGRALEWLRSHGARFIKAGPLDAHAWVFAPPGLNRIGLHWQGRGADLLLRTLHAQFVQEGGQYLTGARAVRLLTRSGTMTGVQVEGLAGHQAVNAGAVILADGGFQANPEMLGRYVTPDPSRVKLRGAETGTGDGIRMAMELGAQVVQMETFYGHCLCRDVVTRPELSDKLWPYPWMDYLATAGVVVTRDGHRYMNEGFGGVAVANYTARLSDPMSASVVFDQTIWEGPGTEFIVPPNPNLLVAGGTLHSAGTAEELAVKAGIDPSGLSQTIAAYNAAVVAGTAELLSPPRSSDLFRPMPIARPPFYSIPMVPGITYTMGGLLVNPHGQVLDGDGKPIGGLYAAGTTMGGIEGGPRLGYAGGLALAVVFGLLGAEHARRAANA